MATLAVDEYYHDKEKLISAYASSLNEEIRDLKNAGADVIQIDEPYLQAHPDEAEQYGVSAIDQALDGIEDGPIMGNAGKVFKPAKAEAYGRVEAPKGELGFYLVADGTTQPYRYRVRPPSFINLTVLQDMCIGQQVADAVIILGSIDIVLGEVDR